MSRARINRRDAVGAGLGLAALGLLRPKRGEAADAAQHYFLQIIIQPGADNMYMFDSRPLAFLASGKMANYTGSEPSIWQGAAGGRCLASPFAAALNPYKSRLAIVNGVHMPSGFDGHDQNVNALLTANPFGGSYFAPQATAVARPVDFLTIGNFNTGVNIANKSHALAMGASVAPTLAANAGGLSGSDATMLAWTTSRVEACATGNGQFSKGCSAMAKGLGNSTALAQRLAKTQIQVADTDGPLTQSTKVALSYFAQGITDVALLTSNSIDFDTHDEAGAKESPTLFTKFFADLLGVFDALANTPFDVAAGQSMLDVTTVMISSEFTRSHGQTGKPATATGTDHNPLANSVLLAGKGIRGDQVIGGSDLDELDADGNFSKVSGAHRLLDAELVKRIGKPFDFDSGEVSAALPTEYNISDYISIASVINTVFDIFGVSSADWLTNDPARQGGDKIAAKTLNKLKA